MKKVIIVGATSGIGQELAKNLVKKGHNIGITGRRKHILQEFKNQHPNNCVFSDFDCTINNNSKKLDELAHKLGGVDLLILSSGIGDVNENLNFDMENNTNQLNVVAFTEIVCWAFNYFKKQQKGHLTAISSVAGLRGLRLCPAYNASKAYQINYLESLRQKAHKLKAPIYITDIRPGFVDTAMAKGDGIFWMSSKEKAAKQILNIINKKKGVAYVSKRWNLIALILKLIPRWLHKIM